MCIRDRAETIRGRLAEFMAERHQVEPAAVQFVDGTVQVAGEVYTWDKVVGLSLIQISEPTRPY